MICNYRVYNWVLYTEEKTMLITMQ